MSFNSIQAILSKIAEKYPGLLKRLSEAQWIGMWEAAAGAQISKHARAVSIKDGTLWIEVDHPAWKTELRYKKTELLQKLQEVAKGSPIQILDIRFLDTQRVSQFENSVEKRTGIDLNKMGSQETTEAKARKSAKARESRLQRINNERTSGDKTKPGPPTKTHQDRKPRF